MRSAWIPVVAVLAGCSSPASIALDASGASDASIRFSDDASTADAAFDAGARDAAADDARTTDAAAPTDVDWVRASARASCASRHGTVWCWGSLWYDAVASPTRIPELDGAIDLDLSAQNVCAIHADHTVWCAGANLGGILGTTGVARSDALVRIEAVTDATAIAVGNHFACALRADGTTWCWGSDELGQTGSPIPSHAPGSAAPQPTPAPVEGVSAAIALDAGGDFACAVGSDGAVRCWGYDAFSALGRGAMSTGAPTWRAGEVDAIHDATRVEVTGRAACAVRADASTWCWGEPVRASPADVDHCSVVVDQACWRTPRHVAELDGARVLSLGGTFACLLTDDAWRCIGHASPSLLEGDGSAMTHERSLVTGVDHVCVEADDGRLRCRGSGTFGELGDGRRESSSALVLAAIP